MVQALERVLADLADRLWSVWLACGVAQVEHRLVGQLVDDRAGHGESTEARVEDPDGSVRHGRPRLSVAAARNPVMYATARGRGVKPRAGSPGAPRRPRGCLRRRRWRGTSNRHQPR